MATKHKASDADILAQLPAARAREAKARRSGLRAVSASYDHAHRRVVVVLSNDYLFGIPVRSIAALRRATPAQLSTVELSPSGSLLHWEALDVDLSIVGLVMSTIGQRESMSELARRAGLVTSDAKAAAARANGARGGRPRKHASR